VENRRSTPRAQRPLRANRKPRPTLGALVQHVAGFAGLRIRRQRVLRT
jgi:hypothetical protein